MRKPDCHDAKQPTELSKTIISSVEYRKMRKAVTILDNPTEAMKSNQWFMKMSKVETNDVNSNE